MQDYSRSLHLSGYAPRLPSCQASRIAICCDCTGLFHKTSLIAIVMCVPRSSQCFGHGIREYIVFYNMCVTLKATERFYWKNLQYNLLILSFGEKDFGLCDGEFHVYNYFSHLRNVVYVSVSNSNVRPHNDIAISVKASQLVNTKLQARNRDDTSTRYRNAKPIFQKHSNRFKYNCVQTLIPKYYIK